MRVVAAIAAGILVTLMSALPAQAVVGVNTSPGWTNTVDGRNIPQMERVLTDFKPHTVRMPWVDNEGTWEALRFNAMAGIDSLVIDHAYDTPETTVAQIAAAEQVGYVEGVNEPDLNGGVPAPINPDKLASVRDRQKRLYDAVAGRWPVLCPAAAWRQNDALLNALACDISNVHRYAPQDGAPPEPADAQLPATGRELWVTETGFSSFKRGFLCPLLGGRWVITPDQQAAYLTRMNQWLVENGAARVILYSLQNTGQNPCASPQNYGLYTWGGVAKPAAAALRG